MGANTLEGSPDSHGSRWDAVVVAEEIMPDSERAEHWQDWGDEVKDVPNAFDERPQQPQVDRGHPVPGTSYTFERVGRCAIPGTFGKWSGRFMESNPGANLGMPRRSRADVPHIIDKTGHAVLRHLFGIPPQF